jgi:hypothetical protein
MSVAKRTLLAVAVVSVMTCWMAGNAFAVFQVSENFDTNPVGNGWHILGETTSHDSDNNNFGWRDSNGADGAASGEMAGQITRRIKAYMAADVGNIDPSNTSLTASGRLMIPARRNGFAIGWFNRTDSWDPAGEAQPTSLSLAFDGVTAQMYVYEDGGNRERSGSLGNITAGVSTPFTLSWDHVSQTMSATLDFTSVDGMERPAGGTGTQTVNWPMYLPAHANFSHIDSFGVLAPVVTGTGHDGSFHIDDLTFTSSINPVPEPAAATLLLLSSLGALVIRRRG